MLKTLGARSSLHFLQAQSQFYERSNYLLVKTPTRPHFMWGNYIIFPSAPTASDFKTWTDLYKSQFPVDQQGYMTFAWDESALGEVQLFQDAGFELNESLVMKLQSLKKPEKLNPKILVRPLDIESDWQQLPRTQTIKKWPLKASQAMYLASKLEALKLLQVRGFGKRFGAFLGDILVGDLGIYHAQGEGRFNNVSTHPDFENQGICQTLVYESSKWMLQNGCHTLVMKASPDEYSSKIYEKVGFETVEKSYGLTWISPGLKL